MKMNVLIAEDERSMSDLYRIALESRGHRVLITFDGSECINAYKEALGRLEQAGKKPSRYEPFDAVVLDYRMPRMDGLEAAKQIFSLNKEQRIIFASAFVKETLRDSVKHLEQVVELIQKPFEPKVLAQLIEDTSATKELQEINRMIGQFDPDKPNDEQISELLDVLKKIQKVGI
jgi:CheY-like chemotaxis protein